MSLTIWGCFAAPLRSQLLAKFGVDAEDMEYATDYYRRDDEEVARHVQSLKQLYLESTGQQEEADLPADLDAKKFCAVLDMYYKVSVRVMKAVIDNLREQGKDIQNDKMAQRELHAEFTKLHNAEAREELKAFGVTPEVSHSRRFIDEMILRAALRLDQRTNRSRSRDN